VWGTANLACRDFQWHGSRAVGRPLWNFSDDSCNRFLAERYYVTFGLWHIAVRLSSVCLSVCRLSSVTLLHHRHRLELSGNIFTPPNSSGTWTLCVKILNKNLKGFRGIVQVKYKGVWKIGVFRPISRFISKMVEDTADERRIVTRMRSIEWCHLQWPWWPLT